MVLSWPFLRSREADILYDIYDLQLGRASVILVLFFVILPWFFRVVNSQCPLQRRIVYEFFRFPFLMAFSTAFFNSLHSPCHNHDLYGCGKIFDLVLHFRRWQHLRRSFQNAKGFNLLQISNQGTSTGYNYIGFLLAFEDPTYPKFLAWL